MILANRYFIPKDGVLFQISYSQNLAPEIWNLIIDLLFLKTEFSSRKLAYDSKSFNLKD